MRKFKKIVLLVAFIGAKAPSQFGLYNPKLPNYLKKINYKSLLKKLH